MADQMSSGKSKRYIVGFRRNDRIGTEEYDGGYSIADARKEAAFFVANLPADVEVKIYTADSLGRLALVEVAK